MNKCRMSLLVLLLARVLCAADKPEHYMQMWTHAGAFESGRVNPDAGPHPPVPIGVSGANCRVLPFYGSWTMTVDTNYTCLPYTTIASGPATSAYLARYNFVVNVFGPCNPNAKSDGAEPDSSCTYTVTNGFQYISYCTDSMQVTWQAFTTSATNPTSGKIEPAFVVSAVAYSPLLEEQTMEGTQVTFWNGASILNCNPTTCTAPCN